MCKFCNVQNETIVHLFWYCNYTKVFWNSFCKFVIDLVYSQFSLFWKDFLLFGNISLFPLFRKSSRKRGKRAGVLVRLRRRAFRPPLPIILLAKFHWTTTFTGQQTLRTAGAYLLPRETRDCCMICLIETWLSVEIPDSAIELSRFSVHHADSMKEFMGKSRGGGVCFFINNSWCDERNIHSVRLFCSPDLEYLTLLCRPFRLPREFTVVIITTGYIPPQANIEQALQGTVRKYK